MRYLRMLTNCVLGGVLTGAYLTILVLQINPHLSLHPANTWPLAATLTLFYGVHAAAGFYALIVLRQLVAAEVLSPGWLSLRLLAWLSAAASSGASVLMWMNLGGLRTALDEEAARRMAAGASAMSLCALALLTIAVVHYSFGRRGSAVGGTLFSLAVVASVTLPLAARGAGTDRPLGAYRLDVGSWMVPAAISPRVMLLLLDGASLDYILPAAAEGRLPNFGRILDSSAAMHLATLRPTQPGPVWAAVATGKYPSKHGVRSAATYEVRAGLEPIELLPDYRFAQALIYLGFLSATPNTSAALRARPLWSILSSLGLSVGVVGWPLTYPAQPVLGYLVSDRSHLVTGSRLDPDVALVAYPQDILAPPANAATRYPSLEPPQRVVATGRSGRPAEDPRPELEPTPRDRLYSQIAADLQSRIGSQLVAVHYQGLDVVGHRFLRYAMPRSFGDVSEEEQRRYGSVLERYYRFIDVEVGKVLDRLDPNDLLLVVSGFGMEPVSFGKRLLARVMGDPDLSGTHENAPDGFMLAYGTQVEPGRLVRGSVVDVAPTILYFLGLPVGRDVDGIARTDMFTRAFTAERPITFIPTYER